MWPQVAVATQAPVPHLSTGCPCVRVCVMSGALHAHVIVHHIFHHKALLQDGAVKHLCLDGDLDLQALAVGLCPYETSVHQLHFLQG